MVDNTNRAGHQAVKRAQQAAAHTDNLGPGTAGHTTSGAAYRGKEIAQMSGAPTPDEVGFTGGTGLGYNNRKGVDTSGYGDAANPGE